MKEAAGPEGREEGSSVAAGGGLTLEERRDRAADPVCADASHAGAGLGPGGFKEVRELRVEWLPV